MSKVVAAINTAQLADLIGVTMQGVQALKKSADPPPKSANGYAPAELREWLKRRHLRGVGVDQEGARYDYEQERARLTKAQADKTELEARELNGIMVRTEWVIEEWGRMLGALRSRMLSLPTKAAPRARGAQSDAEAAALLEAEVIEALQELSDDGLDSRTRSRAQRREASSTPAPIADGKPVGRQRKAAVA